MCSSGKLTLTKDLTNQHYCYICHASCTCKVTQSPMLYLLKLCNTATWTRWVQCIVSTSLRWAEVNGLYDLGRMLTKFKILHQVQEARCKWWDFPITPTGYQWTNLVRNKDHPVPFFGCSWLHIEFWSVELWILPIWFISHNYF